MNKSTKSILAVLYSAALATNNSDSFLNDQQNILSDEIISKNQEFHNPQARAQKIRIDFKKCKNKNNLMQIHIDKMKFHNHRKDSRKDHRLNSNKKK